MAGDTGQLRAVCGALPRVVCAHRGFGPHQHRYVFIRLPSPTLSPTDPVPRGLLTLCPELYIYIYIYAYMQLTALPTASSSLFPLPSSLFPHPAPPPPPVAGPRRAPAPHLLIFPLG